MLPDCTKFVIFLYVEAQKYTIKKLRKNNEVDSSAPLLPPPTSLFILSDDLIFWYDG